MGNYNKCEKAYLQSMRVYENCSACCNFLGYPHDLAFLDDSREKERFISERFYLERKLRLVHFLFKCADKIENSSRAAFTVLLPLKEST